MVSLDRARENYLADSSEYVELSDRRVMSARKTRRLSELPQMGDNFKLRDKTDGLMVALAINSLVARMIRLGMFSPEVKLGN